MIKRSLLVLGLCYIAFISLGMPDALLSVAWPSISREFGVPIDRLGLVLLGGVSGYLISSFCAGTLSARIGVSNLLILSSLLMVMALVGFTLVTRSWLLLPAAFLAGLGSGAIDGGLNTYVQRNYSHRVMQWLHASFGVGVTLGPLIMVGSLVVAQGWRPGYWAVALLLLAMALAFFGCRHFWRDNSPSSSNPDPIDTPSVRASLKIVSLRWSMLAFFLYNGMEVGLGVWAYTILTEGRGLPAQSAGVWVSVYWGSFTLGRVLAGIYSSRFSPYYLALGGAAGSILGLALFVKGDVGESGVYALALIGFCFAPVFPALISNTAHHVGDAHLANAIGMQISAAGFGAALLPPSAGILVSALGLESIPLYICLLTVLLLAVLYKIRPKPED